MKKLVFIVLTVLTITSAIAQETSETITVTGETNTQTGIERYLITVSLKQIVPDGYQQLEPKSLDEVKQTYRDKLKSVGVDFNKFQKNVVYRLYASYSDVTDIEYYNYNATSEEEAMKIITQKVSGLTIVQVEAKAKEQTNTQWADLTLKAIEDAKVKAQKTASSLGKTLGKIKKIENSSTNTQYVNITNPREVQKHYVTVTFALE